jgi:hypothetical protein
MPATKFFTNTNVQPVDVDAYLREQGEVPVWDPNYALFGGEYVHPDATFVYCNATGVELGPLSDIDGDAVEVDLGARLWYYRHTVDLLTRGERSERVYDNHDQRDVARIIGL